MKAVFFLVIIVFMAGCVNAPPVNEGNEKADEFMKAWTSLNEPSGQSFKNFSDRGAIAFRDDDYRFTIILVKDLEWALESMKIADYGLPHISKVMRSEKVSPYLTFGTFGRENVDLTYCIRLQRPDGKFAAEEYHDLLIARSTLFASMTYPAQEFATIHFNQTDALGTYQFHIIIKDGGNVINACIMQFELLELIE